MGGEGKAEKLPWDWEYAVALDEAHGKKSYGFPCFPSKFTLVLLKWEAATLEMVFE